MFHQCLPLVVWLFLEGVLEKAVIASLELSGRSFTEKKTVKKQ